MLYYTLFVKNLHNGTGYIDVALETDELLRDYQQYLDVGLLSHKMYPLARNSGSPGGWFCINLAEVSAVTVAPPQRAGAPRPTVPV